VIAWGRMRAFTALVRPFAERPDIKIPFLYYSGPLDRPTMPANVFGDRWWDVADGWKPIGPGIVPGTESYYSGPIPSGPMGERGGTDAEWK